MLSYLSDRCCLCWLSVSPLCQVATAVGQGFDVIGDGFAVILKKNGRVGTRSKGLPPWEVLVGDVEARRSAGLDVKNI